MAPQLNDCLDAMVRLPRSGIVQRIDFPHEPNRRLLQLVEIWRRQSIPNRTLVACAIHRNASYAAEKSAWSNGTASSSACESPTSSS